MGAYTDSRGLEVVRKCVADYIERRDGIPSDPENIVVTAGASEGIRVKNIKKLSTKCSTT